MFRVAMDILPAQASAVPCERLFSSAKETCTLRRNRISTGLLEALQMLKFRYKQKRNKVKFLDDLVAKEEDYTIEGPVSGNALRELMASGNLDELASLLENV